MCVIVTVDITIQNLCRGRLEYFMDHGFDITVVCAPTAMAAEIAAQYQIRSCDAVYVALAQERGAILITLDRQQRERVPAFIVARSPAEELGRMA